MSECKCDECVQLKAAIAAFRNKDEDIQWRRKNNRLLYIPYKKRR